MSKDKVAVSQCNSVFGKLRSKRLQNTVENTFLSHKNVVISYNDLKNTILKFEYLRTLIAILPNFAYLKDVDNNRHIYINTACNEVFHNENISFSNTLKESIITYEKNAIEAKHEILGKKISPLVETDGTLHELNLSFYPLSVESKEIRYVLVYGSITTESIPPHSLYSLYNSYYTDEKIALNKFISAIGLSDYLDGKQLTSREFECLQILSKGLSAKEMARLLNISTRTVENHVMNIKEKFGVRSTIELLSIFLSCYRIES